MDLSKLIAETSAAIADGFQKRTFVTKQNAATCFVDKKGSIRLNGYTACYGGLESINCPNVEYVVSRILYGKAESWRKSDYEPTQEELKNYLDYVINRSPFEPIFLNKDVEQVMDNGILVINIDQPANFMVQGMIATRYTHEFTHWVSAWNSMVNAGVNEDLAWLILHCIVYNPLTESKVGFSNTGTGHACLSSSVSLKQAKNFLARKFEKARPNYREKNTFRGFDALWDGEYSIDGFGIYKDLSNKSLTKSLKDLAKKAEGSVTTAGNPFAQATTATEPYIAFDEFPKFILSIQDQLLEVINNA